MARSRLLRVVGSGADYEAVAAESEDAFGPGQAEWAFAGEHHVEVLGGQAELAGDLGLGEGCGGGGCAGGGGWGGGGGGGGVAGGGSSGAVGEWWPRGGGVGAGGPPGGGPPRPTPPPTSE